MQDLMKVIKDKPFGSKRKKEALKRKKWKNGRKREKLKKYRKFWLVGWNEQNCPFVHDRIIKVYLLNFWVGINVNITSIHHFS
jgi:hypothetical protein